MRSEKTSVGRFAAIVAAAGAAVGVNTASAQLVNVDPSKANGDYIAGTGIPGDNFLSDGILGSAVFLKVRGRPGAPISGQALLTTGTTFINVTDSVGGTPLWNWDFQFSPRLDDTAGGRNYSLLLDVELDGTSYSAAAPLFDSDAIAGNAWSETDGYFTNPGGGAWSDDDTDYVFSQSWRVGFGFLAGGELPPGDYDISWRAINDDGNEVGSLSATARLIPPATTALTLDATDACLDASEGQLVVAINLSNPQVLASGAQAFLSYDTSKLDYVSADVSDSRFVEILDVADEVNGTIDYAVSADFMNGQNGTTTSTTLATITFDILGDYCAEDALVSFRTNTPPTRVTEFGGNEILPYTMDLGTTTKDSVAPTLSVPDDITVNADAGFCTASLINTWPFDVSPPISASQTPAPGVFYVDRFAPAAFESVFFDGDNRLRHGIDAADFQGCGDFYATQGRKYDINIPLGQKYSLDLYIPSDWATSARRADLWATTRDANGDISGFPILGFINNDPNDTCSITPGSPVSRFRVFSQDDDLDPSNGLTPGWVELGLPAGFTYDRWWTLETELTAHGYIHRVIDDTGAVALEVTDPVTFGSVRTSDLIIQAYNFGETYDVYWDNLVLPPEGAVASDDCSTAVVTFERSDDPLLGLDDPFPTGSTSITWTATDDCGNQTTDVQVVTVDAVNDLQVDVELAGVFEDVDRCITFELTPVGGGAPVVVEETLSFVGGVASQTIEVPCGDYECITARDTLHTLRATDGDDFAVAGTAYVADFTSSGDNDALRGGNFNDDPFIDILDFGVFIGQYLTSVGADTPCPVSGPHADASGNGVVGSEDFTFISTQFLAQSELDCGGNLLMAGQDPWGIDIRFADGPVSSIGVDELRALGMGHLVAADLNHDGMLDADDIGAFMNGALPDTLADLNRDGRVDLVDLLAVVDAFHNGGALGDVNRDGRLDLSDLMFVVERIGLTFGG